MAQNTTPPLFSLIDLAGKFVEQRKGIWDHEAWSDFIADVQKKGFEVTDEMTDYLGSVLESMKQFYQAATATTGMAQVMTSIPKDTVTFIQDHKGVWGQSEWEQFLAELQKKGVAYSDETTNYLGGILESVKRLYSISPLLTEAKQDTKEEAKKDTDKTVEKSK